MNKNHEYHNRRSIRLQGYDYSKEGLYFITICTFERQWLFGHIDEKRMILNNIGQFARQCWQEIPVHFPDVILHQFIVMPDHVHGIIELAPVGVVGVQNFEPLRSTPPHFGVQNFEPLPPNPISRQNEFQKIIPRSIGSIVRGYKIGVSKWFRDHNGSTRVWQRNYFEHIIRDEISYRRISEYIKNNPANWKKVPGNK